jgi:hypothetical protein
MRRYLCEFFDVRDAQQCLMHIAETCNDVAVTELSCSAPVAARTSFSPQATLLGNQRPLVAPIGTGRDLVRRSSASTESLMMGRITRDPVPKSNVIDLKRIESGLDTRSTLMIRNIPNRVSQQDLKEYIDVTNKNTYDFLCK